AYPVRSHASKALIAAGPPALPLLRQALRNPDREVARRAELCIAEIERSPGSALPAAAARLLARRQPPEAVAVLLRYLPHADDETVEEEVLGALVTLGTRPGKAPPALVAAVRNAVPVRRGAAAFVLG